MQIMCDKSAQSSAAPEGCNANRQPRKGRTRLIAVERNLCSTLSGQGEGA